MTIHESANIPCLAGSYPHEVKEGVCMSTTPKVTLLFGYHRAAVAWCVANERDARDPSILIGSIGSEAVRHLRGRNPEDVTIIMVHGWGHRGAQRDEARAMIARYRSLGSEVKVWVGYP